MAVFTYRARGSDNKITSGLVESPNETTAVKLLHEKQLFIISIKKTSTQIAGGAGLQNLQKIGLTEIVNFTRQLATMMVACLSIPEALTILRTQTTNLKFAAILENIEHEIVGGSSFADTLGKYPELFPPTFMALIRAGESSGTLDRVLTRLADVMESEREFRSKVQGAMIYPAIILVGMTVVVFIMMTVVVPKLTTLYKDFNITLPVTTRILIAVSTFFVHFWWLMIGIIIGGAVLFRRWRKTPEGELIVDSLVFKLPIFGNLQKKTMLVEFTRTLGMLIASGVHILDGLRILQESLGNVLFRNAIGEIAKRVEKGFPLGDTFAQYAVFPPIVSQMMKVGEETGKLDDTLTKLSGYFQSETDNIVKGLTTALEPIIMVILGVGVGFIVISVITPIYNLTSQFK